MYSIHAPYSIEKIQSTQQGNKYLLMVYDRPYSIGELIYLIITHIASGKNGEQIARALNDWAGDKYFFTGEKVDAIIESSIRPLGIFDSENKNKVASRLDTISGQWTLVKFQHIKWLLEAVKYLFHPFVFWPVIVAVSAVNFYYMQELMANSGSVTDSLAYQPGGECAKGFEYLALFYPLMLVILFFHEIGHAAAAYMFGVKPKNIGFGFYLIFPVLYADVTEAWKLSKWRKTIVNFGGMYFQLLINLGLLYWLYNHVHDMETGKMLGYIIGLNVATVLINVNPFFKFDGYWIYSDQFELPNLRQQSNYYSIVALKKLFPRLPIQTNPALSKYINIKNPFLAIYSICKYIFMGYMIVLLAKMVLFTIQNVGTTFTQLYYLDFSICAIEFYVKTTLTAGIMVYFAGRYRKSYAPLVRQIAAKYRS
jgi:putative peptide zinc metalloprotease protein